MMVAALDGSILLLQGPRFGFQHNRHSVLGIPLQEGSGLMIKAIQAMCKVGLAFDMVEQIDPPTMIDERIRVTTNEIT